MRAKLAAPLLLVLAAQATAANAAKINNDDLTKCYLDKIGHGSFTSSDGGRSAMRLTWVACNPQATAYVAACKASGKAEPDCNVEVALIAQATIMESEGKDVGALLQQLEH